MSALFHSMIANLRVRLRQRGRTSMSRAMRLTGAAVAAFVVAQVLFPGTVPILAPLTALLVVEITLKDIVTSGVQRVASVTAGVLLAVAFSSIVGLSWWSLGPTNAARASVVWVVIDWRAAGRVAATNAAGAGIVRVVVARALVAAQRRAAYTGAAAIQQEHNQ